MGGEACGGDLGKVKPGGGTQPRASQRPAVRPSRCQGGDAEEGKLRLSLLCDDQLYKRSEQGRAGSVSPRKKLTAPL